MRGIGNNFIIPKLEDSIYNDWTSEAPCFLKNDYDKICKFITKYIKAKSSDSKLLYEAEYEAARMKNWPQRLSEIHTEYSFPEDKGDALFTVKTRH